MFICTDISYTGTINLGTTKTTTGVIFYTEFESTGMSIYIDTAYTGIIHLGREK